jgi:hypothetical protein
MDSRKTPTSGEKRGKTSEHRKTPTGERKKKSTTATSVTSVSTESSYLINKMFTSQASAREEGSTEYDVYAEAKAYEHKHKSSSVSRPSVSAGEPKTSACRLLKLPQREDDAGSETGTYTVQGEKDLKDIENARQSIDKVFGVVDNQEYELDLELAAGHDSLVITDSQEYSPPKEVGRTRTDSQDLDDMEDEINGRNEHDDDEEVSHLVIYDHLCVDSRWGGVLFCHHVKIHFKS